MPFTMTMPKLSPTMEEGTIVKWYKKEGDLVAVGDLLFEVATDKATVEYNALDKGFLRKILIGEGKSAIVNQAVAILTATSHESIEGYQPEGIRPQEAHPSQAPQEESIAPKEIASSESPTMKGPSFVPQPPLENYRFPFPIGLTNSSAAASPLAKKLAQEKGIDLSTVKGTGPSGRIVSKDLDLGQPAQTVTFGKRELPDIAPGTYEEQTLSPMRKVVGQRLQQSKTFIPHFYVRQEVDAAPLFAMREQLKNCNLKVTFNDMVIRAAALSLREHPALNSGFHSVNQTIVLFKTVDISVAVSVDGGLITPILRHADYKNLGEISVEVKELASRARIGKLRPEEYQGGSFSISNLGMYGISDFSAVINPPQAAILAVGGIEECLRWSQGAAAPGKKMGLVLSVDHRVIDGAEAAKFIKTVQKYLENPSALLL